jgi:hypothetical protein
MSKDQYEEMLISQVRSVMASCPLKSGFSFIHKSLFEYFLARAIKKFINGKDLPVTPEVVRRDAAALRFLAEMTPVSNQWHQVVKSDPVRAAGRVERE